MSTAEAAQPSPWPVATPPRAEQRPSSRVVHGVTLSDPYAWLRADNWQDVLKKPDLLAADIRSYLDAENTYAKTLLEPAKALQDVLIAEMRGRIREDDAEPPWPDGPFAYYQRYVTGGNHPLACRTPRGGGAETVLVDGDAEAAGQAFFKIRDVRHSPDHRLVAWSVDVAGSEYFTIRVRNVATGLDGDSVPDTTGVVVWLHDASGFLYVRLDDKHRDNRVFLHMIGTDAANDVLLYEETIPGFFVNIDQTQDEAFALIHINDHETSEVWLVDPKTPTAPPRLVEARRTGLEYEVDHHEGRLIIRTNADGATDFKIVSAPVATPGKAHWADLVPHQPGRLIQRHVCYRDRMVRLERSDAVPRIVIRTWADNADHTIDFDEPTYALSFSSGEEYDTNALRFTYSSLSTPSETWDYAMDTGQRTLLKRREIPSGHKPEKYKVVRLDVPTPDGQILPISLLHRADLALDGTAPCLLYGYGAYGIVMGAGFRSNILSLVDRGFVYAIAHVRGGMEKGYGWYDNGKRQHKPNTFADFITAARALIDKGFTAKGRIVAQGGSAGGMLMGAVANLAPDLFAGIVAQVPFVDVLNTMLDKDLPLTPPEWPEWGNPIESKADFDVIRAYSPYDNLRPVAYPAMLVEGGLTDPRVTYWEPAKWVARLRDTATGGGRILFLTNMDAGHGGASGRLKKLKDEARVYAFALTCVA